jgi:hypothetical protein
MLAKAAVVLAGVLFFATPALAQTNGNTVSGGWTVFGAPGFTLGSVESVGTIHLGGGGQVVWPSGVGLAADVGYLTAAQEFRAGVGIFSPGLIYEFRGAKRYIPYVRAGYTVLFRGETASLVHMAAGVRRWHSPRWGVTLEFRDHFFAKSPDLHLFEFRVGVVIGMT